MLPTVSEPESNAPHHDEVAEVLERLRAGVRQRQAELACLDQQRGDLPAFLAAVRQGAALEEPTFRVEGASALRSFIEKAIYVLFARRQHRALLRQQSRFNRDVELALVELHARNEALASELRAMAQPLRETESRPRSGEVMAAAVVTGPRAAGRASGPS
jgi:hypothetical protein